MEGFPSPLEAPAEFPRLELSQASLRVMLKRTLMTLAIIAAATALAWMLQDGDNLMRGGSVYMAAVIAVSALFGVPYGLLAALLSVLLFNSIFENTPFTLTALGRQDFINATVLVSAALLTGVYAGVLKRRQALVRVLLEVGRGISNDVADASMRQAVEHALNQTGAEPYFQLKTEIRNTSVAILMVLSGTIIAAGLYYVLGAAQSSGIFVASVLIAAITRGARAALVAGIVAVIGANLFLKPGLTLSLGSLQDFMNLFLFSAVAWWVGRYADRVRHQREVARTMFVAGQDLSTVTNEDTLRAVLHRALCRLCCTSSVWVLDSAGKTGDRVPDDLPVSVDYILNKCRTVDTYAVGPWRARRLQAEGCDLGFVVWLAAMIDSEDAKEISETIPILIDLGACAIARARFAAEKAQMDLISQTENLHTALLSSISHDFRTPLSGILGASTSLLELGQKYNEGRKRDLLLNIRDQASRLNRYVENLLSMTRLESGILRIELRPVVLEPLIYDAWESLGDMGGALRIINLHMERNATVLADPLFLFNALTNIFENAIKFSNAGASVDISCRSVSNRTLVEIIDSGPGVEEKDLVRIFDRFYRAAQSTAQGMGLGLYITKQLLEAMNGKIEAHARDDGQSGLKISFTLRTADEQL